MKSFTQTCSKPGCNCIVFEVIDGEILILSNHHDEKHPNRISIQELMRKTTGKSGRIEAGDERKNAAL